MRIRLLVEDTETCYEKGGLHYALIEFGIYKPCKIQVCYGTEIGDTTYYNEWEDIDVVFRSEVGE